MKLSSLFGSKSEKVPCTVEIVNTFESLAAHVRFNDGSTINPGDEVIVDGAPVIVPYGESQSFERLATIKRAGILERTWTRATGDLEFMELCEFSFSERANL
ncbi:MAG: hypothetical protein AAF724_17530 [Pseudomonadota bacterium]